ncbi:MAG: hypothetical protein E5X09_01750 [Mesorhizobium sp.]|nr:MAG: hypothetical protein E5X09_01750 [Mesorhizobium sp.]
MIGSLRVPSFFSTRLSRAGVSAVMAPSAEIHSGQLVLQPTALLRAKMNRMSEKPSEDGPFKMNVSGHARMRTSSAFAAKATTTIASTGARRTSMRNHLDVQFK